MRERQYNRPTHGWEPERNGQSAFAVVAMGLFCLFAQCFKLWGHRDGRLYADVSGQLQEVVYANSADIAKLSYDLSEGYYVVGTGNTGAAKAMFVMGIGYLAIMLTSAYVIRRPAPGYVPEVIRGCCLYLHTHCLYCGTECYHTLLADAQVRMITYHIHICMPLYITFTYVCHSGLRLSESNDHSPPAFFNPL
jgi:hypothetical protein